MKSSILILSKDQPYLVETCLSSLLATVNRDDVEIILGDTGSRDSRVFQIYENFGHDFAGRFSVEQFDFYHFSICNNRLAEKAKGENLVFLNNDTRALPGWLEALTAPFARYTNVGACGAKLLYGKNRRIQHAGMEFVRGGELKGLGYHIYGGRHPEMPELKLSKRVPAVTGACLAMQKSLFEQVGGMDPAYKEEAQDTDLCLKAHRLGKDSVYCADAVLYHFENGTRKLATETADRKKLRNDWWKYVESNFLGAGPQSVLLEDEARNRRAAQKFIRVDRKGARGDVFGLTPALKRLKERDPRIHLTVRTVYPDIVDALSFVDRAMGWEEQDDFVYDEVLTPNYESGEWMAHPHPWNQEMERTMGLSPQPSVEQYRPIVEFTDWERPQRKNIEEWAEKNPFIVIATGASWPEREWTMEGWNALVVKLKEKGWKVVQIGASRDEWVKGALHYFDHDLHETVALCEQASAMVTVDSYPYHLGAAARIPILMLTCKSCTNTVMAFENVQELRNRWATSTPLPLCKSVGCRQKYGIGIENRCETPILKTLSVDNVWAALVSMLKAPEPNYA